jgi:hypothetical protein
MNIISKYGPLVSVIAPILLFMNWIIDNSLVRKADGLKNAMDKMWNERWIYEGLNTIIDEQKNQSLYLYQLNIDKGTPPGWDTTQESREFIYLTRDLGTYANGTLRLTDLVRFADRTQELAAQIPNANNYAAQINVLADSIGKMNEEVQANSKIFERTSKRLFGDGVSALEVTRDKLNILQDSAKPYQRSLKRVGNEYLDYKNKFLRLNTDLYYLAKDESVKSSAKSAAYSRWAIFIYIIGSLLAILAKFIDIKEKAKSKTAAVYVPRSDEE